MAGFGQKQTLADIKNPAQGGASHFLLLFVQILRLRLANPIPNRPMPRSARVPGSGIVLIDVTSKVARSIRVSTGMDRPLA